MNKNWMFYVAVVVAVVWAGFWVWLGVASNFGKEYLGPASAAVGLGFVALMFGLGVAGVVLAFKWPLLGGALLVANGLLLAALPWCRLRVDALPLWLPPVIAGLLFLAAGRFTGAHSSPSPGDETRSLPQKLGGSGRQ